MHLCTYVNGADDLCTRNHVTTVINDIQWHKLVWHVASDNNFENAQELNNWVILMFYIDSYINCYHYSYKIAMG